MRNYKYRQKFKINFTDKKTKFAVLWKTIEFVLLFYERFIPPIFIQIDHPYRVFHTDSNLHISMCDKFPSKGKQTHTHSHKNLLLFIWIIPSNKSTKSIEVFL